MFAKRTLEIKQIKIQGYDIRDFQTLTDSLGRIIGLKQSAADELSGEKNQLLALQNEIKARETAVDELEDQKNAELESLQGELDDCQQAITESNETMAKLKDEISRSESRKQVLSDQISSSAVATVWS